MPIDNTNTKLYVVCGRPGVGKTTYASRLAKQIGAVLVDIDTATETLVKAGLALAGYDSNDRDSEMFKANFREPIHQSLFSIAQQNLPVNSVIIAAPFSQESQNPNWLTNLQNSVWPQVEVHYLICQQNTLRERLEQRGNPRDKTKLIDWPKYNAKYVNQRPSFHHVLVDTSADVNSPNQ